MAFRTDLFPLGGDDLKYYAFTLKGELEVDGRRAFDVLFEPASLPGHVRERPVDRSHRTQSRVRRVARMEKGICRQWQGEVWVDAEEFQPLRIVTKMAKGVPWGVRVFLGRMCASLDFRLSTSRVGPECVVSEILWRGVWH